MLGLRPLPARRTTHQPLSRQVIDGIGEQWTYQEISVSGQGLHIFVHSTSPSYKTKNIEYYSHSRYIKTTGNTWNMSQATIKKPLTSL
ncbi:hypothetical protein BPY_04000 [Bifidobacterium psychraerophilum]|uniref:hypothetical protein n=1 Tax=Bifidobacterium psychraerophilum TaxID=218140 RepID=UPI00310F77E3